MKAICVRNNNGTMMRKAQALTLSVIGVFHKENMEESTGLVDTTIATCKTHLYHIYKQRFSLFIDHSVRKFDANNCTPIS